MDKNEILHFIETFYDRRVKENYNLDLTFSNVKIVGRNVVINVEFPEETNLSMDEISQLWEDLYEVKDFLDVLGNEVSTINFNPIFNFDDDNG